MRCASSGPTTSSRTTAAGASWCAPTTPCWSRRWAPCSMRLTFPPSYSTRIGACSRARSASCRAASWSTNAASMMHANCSRMPDSDTSFAPMSAEVTEDAALGGRLRLKQPKGGHRVGHDAILLAAACPARAGERAVDIGAGVGAAGLALAFRVEGTEGVLVEGDAELAGLAAGKAQRTGLSARVSTVGLGVAAPPRAFAAAQLGPESVARVLMNPPFNDPARQRASPDARRRLAHAGSGAALPVWIKTAARLLRPRGTPTMIWRAGAGVGAAG